MNSPHITSTFLLGGKHISMQQPPAAGPWSDSGNGPGRSGSPFLLDGGKGMP